MNEHKSDIVHSLCPGWSAPQRSPTKKLVPSFLEKYDDRYCNIPNEHAKFTQNVSYENMKIVQNSISCQQKSMKKDVSFE